MVTFASTLRPRSLTAEEKESFESPIHIASAEICSRLALDPHKMASVLSSLGFSLFDVIKVLTSWQQSSRFHTATVAEACRYYHQETADDEHHTFQLSFQGV